MNFDRIKSEQHGKMTPRNDLSSARHLISPRGTTEPDEKPYKEDNLAYSNEIIPVKNEAQFGKYRLSWLLNDQASKINKLYKQVLDRPSSPVSIKCLPQPFMLSFYSSLLCTYTRA